MWDLRNRLILPLLYQEIRSEHRIDTRYLECDRSQIEDIGPLIQMGKELKSAETGQMLKKLANRIVELHDLFETARNTTRADTITTSENTSLLNRFVDLAKPLVEYSNLLLNGKFIERAEIDVILGKLRDEKPCEIYLLGGPGSGKTAILSEVAKRWETEGHVLVLKADLLPVEVDSLDTLAHWILGRENNLPYELSRLALNRPVIIVIDQLDSLANLVDLQSGRLNAILDLIAAIRTLPSISVVAASRVAELKADRRLSALLDDEGLSNNRAPRKAFRIELGVLEKSEVLTQLSRERIIAERWPEDYLRFLAVPYHLAVFLRHATEVDLQGDVPPEESIFSSIRAIHFERWKLLKDGSSGSQNQTGILKKLADVIRDTEVLWHNRINLTNDACVVESLQGMRWLRQEGDQIAFEHQTQYEFVMAMNLATDVERFVSHVSKRQHGLQVRPCVWHTLRFLREQSEDKYIHAMSGILALVERRHLKRLLIEFVCSVRKPIALEVQWMQSWLRDPDTIASASFLLRGHREWFDALPDKLLQDLMVSEPFESWPITRVLESAVPFASDRVANLIREKWAFRSCRFANLSIVISKMNKPSPEHIIWMRWIIETQELDEWKIDSMRRDWKDNSPRTAISLTTAWLHRWADKMTVREELEIPDTEKTYRRRHGQFIEFMESQERELEKLWFNAEELAEKEPIYFLTETWPWLVRILLNHTQQYRSRLSEFRQESIGFGLFPSTYIGSGGVPIVNAIEGSLKHLAMSDLNSFIGFVIANLNVDSAVIQRILLRAVRNCAKRAPDFVLAILRHDTRRLWVDGDHHSQSETVSLIRAVMPYWNQNQLTGFQDLICNWNPYRDDDESNYTVQYRADLLRWIPSPHRNEQTHAALAANKEFQLSLESERNEATIDQLPEQPEAFQMPSNDQLRQMTAKDVASVLNQISLLNRRIHGRANRRSIDSFEFERALGARFEGNFKFASHILDELVPGNDDVAAASVLKSIPIANVDEDRDEFTLHDYQSLITHAVTRGFSGRKFHDAVGRLVYQLATRKVEMPAIVVESLQSWLLTDSLLPSDSGDSTRDTSTKSDYIEKAWQEDRTAVPILWGPKQGDMIPEEFYWMAEAIKLLEYNATGVDVVISWADVMDVCVDRDFPDSLWRSWLYAAYAYVPDRAKFAPVLSRLLAARPSLLNTPESYLAIKKFSPWLDSDTRMKLVQKILESELTSARQAAGELAALFAIRDKDEPSKQMIQKEMLNSSDSDNEAFLTGVVHTAAYLFPNAKFRLESGEFLVSACRSTLSRVVQAFSIAFHHENSLIEDSSTHRLLAAMNETFCFNELSNTHGLPNGLWHVTDSHPLLVLRICQKLVAAERNGQAKAGRYGLGLGEEILVKIATTLHRKDEPIRKEALTLFEDLQEIEASGVKNYLQELDGRVQ